MTARHTTRGSGQEGDGQLSDRSSAERDEWRAAGAVASGLERARVSLALARRRADHADAEGIAYA